MRTIKRITLLIVIFAFNLFRLNAQLIQIPGDVELTTRASEAIQIAYESIEINVEIRSNKELPLLPVQLDPGLPPGVYYVSGSVNGMVEAPNCSPEAPLFVFEGEPMLQNDKLFVTFRIEADCQLLNYIIDNFTNPEDGYVINTTKLIYSIDGIMKEYDEAYGSESYSVLYPDVELFMKDEDANIQTLLTDKPFHRKITIKNTGFGPTTGLTLSVTNDSELSYQKLYLTDNNFNIISTLTPSANNGNELIYNFSDFSLIGNGDALLGFNESIYLMDEVSIPTDDCHPVYESAYKVRWGDGKIVCNEGDIEADFNAYINVPSGYPDVYLKSISTERAEDCGNSFSYVDGYYNVGNKTENPIFDALFDAEINIYTYYGFSVQQMAVVTKGGGEVVFSYSPGSYTSLNGVFSYDVDGEGGLSDVDGDGYYDDIAVGDTLKVKYYATGLSNTQGISPSANNSGSYYGLRAMLCGKSACKLFGSRNYNSNRYRYHTYSIGGSEVVIKDAGIDTINNTVDYQMSFNASSSSTYNTGIPRDPSFYIDLPSGYECFDVELLSGSQMQRDSFQYSLSGNYISFSGQNLSSSTTVKVKTQFECPEEGGNDTEMRAGMSINTCVFGSQTLSTGVRILPREGCCSAFSGSCSLERRDIGYEPGHAYSYGSVFLSGSVPKASGTEESPLNLHAVTQRDLLQLQIEGAVNLDEPVRECVFDISYGYGRTYYQLYNVESCQVSINGEGTIDVPLNYVFDGLSGELHTAGVNLPLGELGLPSVLNKGDYISVVLNLRVRNIGYTTHNYNGVVVRSNLVTTSGEEFGCVLEDTDLYFYNTSTSYYNYSVNVQPGNTAQLRWIFRDYNYSGSAVSNESRFSGYLSHLRFEAPPGFEFTNGTGVEEYSYTADEVSLSTGSRNIEYKPQLVMKEGFNYPPLGVRQYYSGRIYYSMGKYAHLDLSEHDFREYSTSYSVIYELNKGLRLTTNDIQEGIHERVSWPIQLECYGNTGHAYNTYIAVELRPEDKSTVLEGIKDQTGKQLPVVFYGPTDELNPAGRYMMVNIGTLNVNTTEAFEVIASYRNCEDDVLQDIDVYASHNPTGTMSPPGGASIVSVETEQIPLQRGVITIRYRTANMQWNITQDTNWDVELCEDVDFGIDVLSSKYANMKNVELKVTLPNGIQFNTQNENTAWFWNTNDEQEIAKDPDGSKTILKDVVVNASVVPDVELIKGVPTETGGYVYTWKIDDLMGHEFVGTNKDPMNEIIFGLQLENGCNNFDPGAPIRYELIGYTNCQDLIHYKDQRKINLVDFPIDNLSIELSADEMTACKDYTQLVVQVTNEGGNNSSHNRLLVDIDPRLVYESNTSDILGEPVLLNGGKTLQWELEYDMLATGESYEFGINLREIDIKTSTGVHYFDVATKMDGEGKCIKDGTVCPLIATTGKQKFTLISNVEPPYPSISCITQLPVCPRETIRLQVELLNEKPKEGTYHYIWYHNGKLIKSSTDDYVDIVGFTFTSLGTAKVVAIDPDNCDNFDEFDLTLDFLYAEPLFKVDEIIETTCPTSSDASVAFHLLETEPGMQAPFNYIIRNLDNEIVKEAVNVAEGAMQLAEGLEARTYQIIISDQLGCTTTKSFVVPNGGPYLYVNCISTAPCDVEDNQLVEFTLQHFVKRGRVHSPDYTFNIEDENGNTLMAINGAGSYNVNETSNVQFRYIADGKYFFKIYENGVPCGDIDPVEFTIDVTQWSIAIDDADHVYRRCHKDHEININVAIDLNVTGCTSVSGNFYGELLIQTGGSAYSSVRNGIVAGANRNILINNVENGSYKLIVSSADRLIGSCTKEIFFDVIDSDVEFWVDAFSPKCEGEETGEAIANVKNGVPNYKYYWFDQNNELLSVGPTVDGLSIGDYYLKFSDNSGCNMDNFKYEFSIEEGHSLGAVEVYVPDEMSEDCDIVATLNDADENESYTFKWHRRSTQNIFDIVISKLTGVEVDDVVYTTAGVPVGGTGTVESVISMDVLRPGDDYIYYVEVIDGSDCNTISEDFVVPEKNIERVYNICFKYSSLPVGFEIEEIPVHNVSGPEKFAKEVFDAIEEVEAYCSEVAANKSAATYEDMCLSKDNLNDELTLNYTEKAKHFTLYYYDRAGNLVKTVPPKGVKPLQGDEISRSNIPQHTLATTYQYNGLGQLISQNSPDGGTSTFVYDDKGQLRFSQNAKQAGLGLHSYTKYDALGRIIEVGEGSIDASQGNANSAGYPAKGSSGLSNQTYTYYSGESGIMYNGQSPQYTLNRVSSTEHLNSDGEQITTWFSYDPHGNVEWMVQKIPGIEAKSIEYDYDLISGNVNKVTYNKGKADQFIHRYAYDEDNRIQYVETSADGVIWERDASYEYYQHGPLRRVELGEDRVQGLDYVYTLQGWLKAINHPELDPSKDPGADGTLNKRTGHDVFGMVLSYYNGDFKDGGSVFDASATTELKPERDLFNGNIGAWTHQQALKLDDGHLQYDQLKGQQFVYDQLNRLKQSKFSNGKGGSWSATSDYETNYAYDPNGNITSLSRMANNNQLMDQLSYNYTDCTNQLESVDDAVTNAALFDDDVDDQNAGNYAYDAIGNLTKDEAEGITNISWTVYGKVDKVSKNDGSSISFKYDAAGNRVKKTVENAGGMVTSTYYVRDASGNILSVYTEKDESVIGGYEKVLTVAEQPIYGSSRVGLHEPNTQVQRVRYIEGMEPMVIDNNLLYQSRDVAVSVPAYNDEGTFLANVDFQGDEPVVEPTISLGATNALQVTSATNENGRLMFTGIITDEYHKNGYVVLVTDANGEIMPGSGGILPANENGIWSVQQPGDENKYLLFTFNLVNNLLYHTVDMQQPGNGDVNVPQGDMVQMNTCVETRSLLPTLSMVRDNRDGSDVVYLYTARVTTANQVTPVVYSLNEDLKPNAIQLLPNVDGNYKLSSSINLSADGNVLALMVHQGAEDPLYGHAKQGAAIYLYQVNAENHTLTAFKTITLNEPQKISSLCWGGDGTQLYYVTNTLGDVYSLKRLSVLSDTPEPYTYAYELNSTGNLQLGTDNNVYLAIAGESSLKIVGETTVSDAAVSVAPDYLSGVMTRSSHTVSTKAQGPEDVYARTLGKKQYELTDHLGNVRATISDRLLANTDGTLYPELLSSTTYYPFGMGISSLSKSGDYRFGFNGKELDNEWGLAKYDYGFRIYNPGIGKFLSVDPLTKSYPFWAPYVFAGNTPIQAVDLDGLEILGYRSMFEIKVTKSKAIDNYYVITQSGHSLRTFNNRSTSGYMHAGLNKGIVWSDIKMEIPVFSSSEASSPNMKQVDGGYIYDKFKTNSNQMMQRKYDGSLSGDLKETNSANDANYQYLNRQNRIASKGGALADAFVFGLKTLYHYSPVAISDDNWADYTTQINAYITAFNEIESYLGNQFDDAPEGLNIVAFRANIAQYIVDGSLPRNGKLNDSIVEFGEYVKSLSKVNLDTKKVRNSDR